MVFNTELTDQGGHKKTLENLRNLRFYNVCFMGELLNKIIYFRSKYCCFHVINVYKEIFNLEYTTISA